MFQEGNGARTRRNQNGIHMQSQHPISPTRAAYLSGDPQDSGIRRRTSLPPFCVRIMGG